jgi:hypothetical protein
MSSYGAVKLFYVELLIYLFTRFKHFRLCLNIFEFVIFLYCAEKVYSECSNVTVFLFQQMEFEWVLHEEVHAVLNQLHTILLVSAINTLFGGLYLILLYYSSNM